MMTVLEVARGLGLNHLPTDNTDSTQDLASATKPTKNNTSPSIAWAGSVSPHTRKHLHTINCVLNPRLTSPGLLKLKALRLKILAREKANGRGLGGTHHTNHQPHTSHHQVLVHHQTLRGKSSTSHLTHSNIVTVARAEEPTTSPQASQLTSTARGTSSRSHLSASLAHEDCQRLAPWCQPGMSASHVSHTTIGHAGTSLIRLSLTHINYNHRLTRTLRQNHHTSTQKTTPLDHSLFSRLPPPLEAASPCQTSQDSASRTTTTHAHLCPSRSAQTSTNKRTSRSNDVRVNITALPG